MNLLLDPAEHSMGALQPREGADRCPREAVGGPGPRFLRSTQTRTVHERERLSPRSPPNLTHAGAFGGQYEVRVGSNGQTIVCPEPLRFSESFYVANHLISGLDHDTGGRTIYLDMVAESRYELGNTNIETVKNNRESASAIL